jgi:hypothetical protein
LTLTIPSVGAYLSGAKTVAHTWCPSGTASNYASIVFYPEGDSVDAATDVLASTTDGQHVLGAAIGSNGVELSDIGVSIPFTPSSGTATGGSSQIVNLPKACPQDTSTTPPTMLPLNLTHTVLNQVGVTGINATALNQIVTSPASNLAFITYQGSTAGAKLPYCVPVSGGAGSVNYLDFANGSAVTAPLAGAFSLDNQLFFVSTAGDDQIHFIKTTTLQDTQQISPNLPACTPGTDPDCVFNTNNPVPTSGIVPATVIVVKPRTTT